MNGVEVKMEVAVGEMRFAATIYQTGTGNSFGITVNKSHQGYLVKYSEGWIFWPSSPKANIYSEDIFIILDIIKEQFPNLTVFETHYHFCPRVDVNSRYDHCYLIPLNKFRRGEIDRWP